MKYDILFVIILFQEILPWGKNFRKKTYLYIYPTSRTSFYHKSSSHFFQNFFKKPITIPDEYKDIWYKILTSCMSYDISAMSETLYIRYFFTEMD